MCAYMGDFKLSGQLESSELLIFVWADNWMAEGARHVKIREQVLREQCKVASAERSLSYSGNRK